MLATLDCKGAKSNLAAIVGTAMDASDSAVPKASVKVTSVDTGFSREFRTGDSGTYEVDHLQPGRYRVEADSSGFRHFVHTDIVLYAGQTVRIDVRFEIESVAQQTSVSEEGTPTVVPAGASARQS